MERLKEKLIGVFGILDFKEGAEIASIGGDTISLKDNPGVVIGYVVVLNFTGIVSKGNAVAI